MLKRMFAKKSEWEVKGWRQAKKADDGGSTCNKGDGTYRVSKVTTHASAKRMKAGA